MRPNPRSKSNRWVAMRDDAIRCMTESTYEGIILSDGEELLEGFTSNFYAIVDGVLFTSDREILHGIARQVVLNIVTQHLPAQFKPIRKDQLAEIDEAFLTSSSRGIVPIIQIDTLRVGNGRPGRLTQNLSDAYDHWVDEHLEPIVSP
jgi:branched-chain amino acid aminotransferase